MAELTEVDTNVKEIVVEKYERKTDIFSMLTLDKMLFLACPMSFN